MPPTRRRFPRPRLTRRRVVAAAVVLALVAGVVVWSTRPAPRNFTTRSAMITVETGPGGNTPVSLDTTYYQPGSATADHPAPAILLAHGFGGTKDSVADTATDLANRGYAVLTWTAEGFGRSGGQIHLDSPDWEVRDASALIDWLALRPEVRRDRPGDPRVGVLGGSYGGGLALLLAGYDHRVDAIVPQITWNDLASSFLPEATGRPAADGVFKRAWAGLFFGAAGADLSAGADLPGGLSGGTSATGGSTGGTPPVGTGLPGGTGQPGTGQPGGAPVDPTCGRFAQDVCHAYLTIATAGHGDQSTVDLLHRSSPASILDRITAPTLLVQGEADSLFPLSEAEANAKGIAAHGTPVRVAWFTGGHDGGSGPQSDQDRVKYLTAQWFDHYLRGAGPAPSNSFTYSRIAGLSASTDGYVALGFSVADYPGLSGNATVRVPVAGAPQPVANPPNGTPGALSSLPGTGGGVASLAGVASDIPGQHADFYSAPLRSTVDVVGAPAVRIRAASPTGEAVLFVKLYDLDPSSGASLPDGLVAPVRLSGLPASIEQATPVTVTLPAIVHRFEAGHLLRITIATSDQGYATPAQPALYTVALGDPATANTVALPTVRSEPIATPNVIWRWVLVALGVLIALGIATAVLVGRRRYRRAATAGAIATAGDAGPADPDVPLVVQGLRKAYDDGFVAVSNVDFIVHRGQVVGLLGPNGAGKTTTLRVLMGLTRPTAGEVYVFGHRLVPGAPVLSRIGALVEGPGFMPHVSGLGNLRLYWQATGRPERDAHFEEALEIAGLGDAIHRKVRKYSHGMKQRLAIAQAMLGLPDLLVLDEPTDGLDPPQIAEMRRVLHRYADPAGGRTVLLSSHLLAEVEQTCTHVVVVNKGRVVAQGPVDEIVGESPSVAFEVSDVDAGAQALRRLAGVGSVVADGSATLVADLDGTPRSAAVAALVNAGVGVNRVVPRRRLEDAFLSLVRED